MRRKELHDDARAALQAAALALCRRTLPREPLRGAPDKMNTEPWVVAAWERATDSDECFWLWCSYSTTTREFAALLEAVDIFALVARVDLALWKELAREVWKLGTEQWADLVATRSALYVGVDVRIDDDADDIVEACESVVAWLRAPRSHHYVEARAILERMARATGVRLPVVPIRINLVERAYDDDIDIPDLLWSVYDCLANQPSTGEATSTARVTHYKAGSWNLTMNGHAIAALAEIRSLGVRVSDLALTRIGHGDLDRLQCLYEVPQLLDAFSRSNTDVEVRRNPVRRSRLRQDSRPSLPQGVENVFLSSCLPETIIPAVCSSIHASQSLRSVVIEMGDGNDRHQRDSLFQWIAYALFRRKPLAQLTISESEKLQLDDVRSINHILTAPNPLSALFREEITPYVAIVDGTTPHEVVITETSEMRLNHPSDTTSRYQRIASSALTLDIIGGSRDGYLPVLLPGWGMAWVNETDGLVRPKVPVGGTPVIQSPTRLVIQSSVTSATAAMRELVRLIGQNVKQVMILEYSCDTPALDDFCTEIFTACPQLEELELHNLTLHSLQFVLDAFAANRCPCLKKLTLFSVNIGSVREVDSILRALADPANVMAAQLRTLFLHLSTNETSTETLALLEDMLERNSLLREVKLEIQTDRQMARVQSRFKRYHNREILGDPVPAPRRTVLALLSVVAHRGRTKGKGRKALQQFDSLVLARILSFAGVRRVRSVSVLTV